MNDKLNILFAKIQELEREIAAEIHERQEKFGYKIRGGKVRFKEAIAEKHRKIAKTLLRYMKDARFFSIITGPVIWFCIFPVLFMHATAAAYQFICFPFYGIPKVRREDYIVMDRRRLRYLNSMEKFNCFYCEYVNGMLAYVQEIAGRTERSWCPIKHALNMKTRHSRYQHFLDYGDAEQYRQRIEQVRRDFADLKKEK